MDLVIYIFQLFSSTQDYSWEKIYLNMFIL